MSWHDFVFSEQKSIRYLRHTTFWIVWWIFYTSTMPYWWVINVNNIYLKHPGWEHLGITKWTSFVFIKSFFYLLIHLCACYTFLYVVLPRFLLKRNYIKLAGGIVVIGVSLVATGYLIQSMIFPMLEIVYHVPPDPEKNVLRWNNINSGLLSAPKVIAVATIIKLLKRWWLKQKEKERLEKEIIETELELLKAQIHPEFLFNSLNNIYSFAMTASPRAPEMLLKLSDILSYMLYECTDALVPLEKEIKMLKDYMSLEKTRYGDGLEMNLQVKGETCHYMIAPLLLLRFLENSFRQCGNKMIEQPWINLEINIENKSFYMKLINGKFSETPIMENGEENDLSQARKSLQLLYPGKHNLKIVEEPEILMVSLEMELEEKIAVAADRGNGIPVLTAKPEYIIP